MAEDIAPALLEQIQATFAANMERSKRIQALRKAVDAGTATHMEVQEYALEVGNQLAAAFQAHLSSDVLPDGRMFYNIAQRVVREPMEQGYELVAQAAVQVQEQMNQAAGIGLQAVKPTLNDDRIRGIVDRLDSEASFDDVAWILDQPVVTFTQSVADDAVKANAEIQAQAGLYPKIVRKAESKCCAWCSALGGVYEYPDVPDDIYRRHENCRCTVTFDPGSGKRQNVWTKRWTEDAAPQKIQARKQIGL